MPIVPGGTVVYDLTVYNQGTIDAYNIQLSDYVPTGLTLEAGNGWSMVNGVAMLDSPISRIDAGESLTVKIIFTVDYNFMETSITNNAEIASQEDEDGPRDDDDSVAGDEDGSETDDQNDDIDETNGDDDYDPEVITIQQTYDLALTKALVSEGPFMQGDVVTYRIYVYNQGTLDAAANTVTVTDYVPEDMTNVDPDWTNNTYTFDRMIPSRTGIDSVDIDLRIDPTFQGTSITNNAEITSDGGDDVDSSTGDNSNDPADPNDDSTDDGDGDLSEVDPSDDDYDPADITVTQIYDLSITKDIITPGPYTPGQDVIFHMTVCNEGTLDAQSFDVSDIVPAGLSLSSMDINGWQLSTGTTYTIMYDEELPAVNPDSCVVFPIVLTLDDDFDGGSVVNMANLTNTDQVDDVPGNNTDDELLSLFDVALTKVINTDLTPSPSYQGGPVSYDITIYNQGTVPAYDIAVEDYYNNDELIFVDMNLPSTAQSGNAISAIQSGSTFTLDALAPGDEVVVTLNFTIHPMATNDMIVNNAEITFAAASPGGDLAIDEDSPLDEVNDGSTNELSTDNEVSDNIDGGLDLEADQDDYDPALLNVILCAPQVNACPANWNVTAQVGNGSCVLPSMNTSALLATAGLDVEDCGNGSLFSSSYVDSLVREECVGATSFDERTVFRTYTITNAQTGEVLGMCPQEITYDIEECQVLTDFGVIGINSSTALAVPSGCDIPTITVTQDEQGVCGYVEYMWLVSTEEDANGNPIIPNTFNIGTTWQLIPGAQDPTYNPGSITQNTHYVRCARNFGCCDFGESNIVSLRVEAGATCPIENTSGPIVNKDCNNSVLLTSPNDDFVTGEQMKYITDQEINASNKTMQGSSLTLDGGLGVEMGAGFEIGTSSKLEVYTTGCPE